MGGVFFEWKMFFAKKWKMEGVFFVKSGPFLNAGCIMYSISIFFISHFTYLGEGCIRTPCLQACCKGGMGPWGSADKLYLDCQ